MSALRHGRLVTVLTVLVALLSGAALVLGLTREAPAAAPPAPGEGSSTYRTADFPGEAGEALAAAVSALPQVLSYDHRRLKADLLAATELMTADYARSFRSTFNTLVRPLARQDKRVSRGEVVAAGVVSTPKPGRVIVLAFVDQRLVKATSLPKTGQARITTSRVRLTMVLRAGEWRVGGLTVV